MNAPNPHTLAHQVHEEERLPPLGRDAPGDLARVEALVREAMAPDVPTWDVGSVQGVGFDEWCYSEHFGCMCLWTQSVEVNVRIALEAVSRTWDDTTDHAAALHARIADKWASAEPPAHARRVWFPPGANLGHLVATDQVLRAFDRDPAWVLKPHPVTSAEDVRAAERALGRTRVLPREWSAVALLRAAETIGYTTSSELGIFALLAGVPAVDFSRYEVEHEGRLYSVYRALREAGEGRPALTRMVSCAWSGLIPLDTPDKEVLRRTRAFKRRSIQLRDRYRPLVPRAPY